MGTNSFHVSATARLLCVELRQLSLEGDVSSCAVSFESEAAFLTWCDSHSLRFSNPVLHSSLKRHACALFTSRQATSAE